MREGWWWAVKAAVAGVLVLSLLAVAGWKSGDKLPADPLQRVAAKALRGDYGKLENWQRVGYEQALKYGGVKRKIWLTSYYTEEGFPRGATCRWWGEGCSERVAAANELPGFAFIWIPEVGLRQVLDTGARSNDSVARRKGAHHWVDIWEAKRGVTFGDDNGGIREAWGIRGRMPARWASGRKPRHAWLDY